jgi:MarR family transcriptional regulator, organic hydroperoxide resistance regulator
MAVSREERFYFHLQIAAARLRAEADRRCIDQAGVTAAQAAALAVIHEQPGVSQRGLAEALHQTELVRRLLAAGLIVRTVGPSDGRTRALVLSENGGAALAAADWAFSEINQGIDGLLTDDEVRQTADVLRRLAGTGSRLGRRRPGGHGSS